MSSISFKEVSRTVLTENTVLPFHNLIPVPVTVLPADLSRQCGE